MRTASGLIAVLTVVAVAACGGEEEATTSSSSSTTATSEATTTTAASAPTTELTTTTTLAPATTASAPTTTTLAGEPMDFGPRQGDVLMVIGVRHDDVLNLRAGPGVGSPVVAEIPPTYTDLVALGNTRDLPGAFWIEVDYDGADGWVNISYIAYEGVVDDLTSVVTDQLGELPVAQSMTDLGEVVAEVFESDEPESDIVQVTPVTTGDLTEVTYDVIGLGDDAVRGLRLHVFATPSGDGFALKSVEVTSLCGRGVDADGFCV